MYRNERFMENCPPPRPHIHTHTNNSVKNTCSSTHLFGPFRDGFQPFPFRHAYQLKVCRKSWFLLNWIPFIKVFGNVILMEIFGFIYFLPNVMHLYPEYLKGLTVSYLPSLSDSLNHRLCDLYD